MASPGASRGLRRARRVEGGSGGLAEIHTEKISLRNNSGDSLFISVIRVIPPASVVGWGD